MKKRVLLFAVAFTVLWYSMEVASAEPVVINEPIRIFANGTVLPPNAPIVFSNGVFKLLSDIVVNVTLTSAFNQSQIYEYFSCFYPIDYVIVYDFSLTSGISLIGDGIIFDGEGHFIEVHGPALSLLRTENNYTYLFAHGLFGIYVNGTSVTIKNARVRVYIDRVADADISGWRPVIPFQTRYGYPTHASINVFWKQGELPSITLENVEVEPAIVMNLDELQNIYYYFRQTFRNFSIFIPGVTGAPVYVCFLNREVGYRKTEPLFSLFSLIPLAFVQPEKGVVSLKNVTASFLVINASTIYISSSKLSDVFLFSKGRIFLNASTVTARLVVDGHLQDVWSSYLLEWYSDERAPVFNGVFRAWENVFNNSLIYIGSMSEVVLRRNIFANSSLAILDNFKVLVEKNVFLLSSSLMFFPYYDYDTGSFHAGVFNVTRNNFYLLNISTVLSPLFLSEAELMLGLRSVLFIQGNFWNGSTTCTLSPPSPGQSFSLSNSEIPFCLIDEGSHDVSFHSDLTGFNWTWRWVRGVPDGVNDVPVVIPFEKEVYDPTTDSTATFTMYYMVDPYPSFVPIPLEEEEQQEGGQPSPPSPRQPSSLFDPLLWFFIALPVLAVLLLTFLMAARHAITDLRNTEEQAAGTAGRFVGRQHRAFVKRSGEADAEEK